MNLKNKCIRNLIESETQVGVEFVTHDIML